MSANKITSEDREPQPRGGRVGRGSRLVIGTQVLVAGALALAALIMVNWLAGRPGVRMRLDLTAKARNSLDPASELVLDSLQEPVSIDVFFRRERQPLTDLVAEVQGRTMKLLILMEAESAGQVEVRVNDMTDRVATQERLRELRIRGLENCLIVSRGNAREVVSMYGDLAEFDLGNPAPDSFKPPSVLAYSGERAIVAALLKVTRGERPRVLFLEGHGEPAMMGESEDSLGRLHATLRDDGLTLETWNRLEDGPLPEDATAIAIVGPTQPLGEELIDELEAYARAGGRLMIAPPANVEDLKRCGLMELSMRFGIELGEGTVMQVYVNPDTGRPQFGQYCQQYDAQPQLMRRHPVLDAIRNTNSSFKMVRMHPVRVASQITKGQGLSMPLVETPPNSSWLDDPYPLNYQWDEGLESFRSFDVMAAVQFVPEEFLRAAAAAGPKAEASEKVESRLVILGCSDMLVNVWQQFNAEVNLAAFNWLTDREWRVSVSPKDPDRRILPAENRKWVVYLALWILPGIALLGGVLTAFFRRRN